MNKWPTRLRYYALTLTASGLFLLGGCGLSDQQWAQIWQSIVSSALTTVVSQFLRSLVPAATA